MGNTIFTHDMRLAGEVEGSPLLDAPGATFGANPHADAINKLANILLQKSMEKTLTNGILRDVFVEYVFGDKPELGSYVFNYMYVNAKAKNGNYLDVEIFCRQCEMLISAFNPADRFMNFVKMFSVTFQKMTPSDLRALLLASYNLTTTHCLSIETSKNYWSMIERTFQCIIKSCFFKRNWLTIDSTCQWIDDNLPNLIPVLIKFTVYRLTTAYRKINVGDTDKHDKHYFLRVNDVAYDNITELAVLIPTLEGATNCQDPERLLCRARVWLLSSVLSIVYCKPQLMPFYESYDSILKNPSELTPEICRKRVASASPSNWTVLYDTNMNATDVKRFAEHVRYYLGPTVCLIGFKDYHNDDYLFCVGSSLPWKEAHLYDGDENCCILQLLPNFAILETGTNLIHLKSVAANGSPLGLSFGPDYTNPIIHIEEDFDSIICEGRVYDSPRIVVWGCAGVSSYNIQVDFKKWQAMELKRLAKLMPNRLTI